MSEEKRASQETCEEIARFENLNPDATGQEIADQKNVSANTVYFCHSHYPELFDPIEDSKVEQETEGNYTVIEGTGQIKTLDGLIEEADVDQEEWEVYWHNINKWPTTMRGPGDLPVTVENWKVEAKLQKKEVEPVKFKPVEPVTIEATHQKPDHPTKSELERAVLIPDVHIGYRRNNFTRKLENFHDRRNLDLAIQLIDYVQPQVIVLLGDYLDMPNWSKNYVRSEEFSQNTQPALDEGIWWLQQIRETAPNSKVIYIQGNHENRVQDFLEKNNKAACGLKKATATKEDYDIFSVPNMIDLKSLGIDWIGDYPDGAYWPTENLKLYHGDKISSVIGKTARNNMEDSTVNRAFAHSHRLEKVSKTIYQNNERIVVQSVCLGTLAKIGGKTPGTKEKQNWQNALGVVSFDQPSNSKQSRDSEMRVNIEDIKIDDGWFNYSGKDFYGKTRLKQIRNDTKLEKYQFAGPEDC